VRDEPAPLLLLLPPGEPPPLPAAAAACLFVLWPAALRRLSQLPAVSWPPAEQSWQKKQQSW
jgi:hypothetical protein